MSNDLATWAGVIVTAGAVIVALFQPRFFSRLWRPTVSIKGNVEYFSVRGEGGQTEGRGYARLEVEAGKRGPAAEDLRIYLLTCDPAATLGGDSSLTQGKFHIPLRWAFSHLESATLPPGIPSYVDLARLKAPTAGRVQLLTVPAPDEGYVLTGRTQPYTIHVAVAAKNMPAQRWQLRLTHLGDWNGHQGKLRSSLGVEDVSKVS